MRPEPDCAALHLELRRPGVTLALLHIEYLGTHPDGVRYTAFCERYRTWRKRHSPVMRQVHAAGDKMFVDYAGMKPRIVDASTGEVIEVELFVAVLGASNYTFGEASNTRSTERSGAARSGLHRGRRDSSQCVCVRSSSACGAVDRILTTSPNM